MKTRLLSPILLICLLLTGAQLTQAATPAERDGYFRKELQKLNTGAPLSETERNRLEQHYLAALAQDTTLSLPRALAQAVRLTLHDRSHYETLFARQIADNERGSYNYHLSTLQKKKISGELLQSLEPQLRAYAHEKAYNDARYADRPELLNQKNDSLQQLLDRQVYEVAARKSGQSLGKSLRLALEQASALNLSAEQQNRLLQQGAAIAPGETRQRQEYQLLEQTLNETQLNRYFLLKNQEQTTQGSNNLQLIKSIAADRYRYDQNRLKLEQAHIAMHYESKCWIKPIEELLKNKKELGITPVQADSIVRSTLRYMQGERKSDQWEGVRSYIRQILSQEQFYKYINIRNRAESEGFARKCWRELKEIKKDAGLDSARVVRSIYNYHLSQQANRDYHYDNPARMNERSEFLRKQTQPKELKVIYAERRKSAAPAINKEKTEVANQLIW